MLKRGSGILAHITSFDSKYGIGDFGSGTIRFLEFLENAEQRYWQILPLGPTSFGDSPYQSFSTFAINTLLISPDLLIKERLLDFDDIENQLPKDYVDYGNVQKFKNDLYNKAYNNFLEINDIEKVKKFKKFKEENEWWLKDYALFMSLKEYFIEERKNSYESLEYREFYKDNKKFLNDNEIKDYFYGGMWLSFPEKLKNRDKKELSIWTEKLEIRIEFHSFLQFMAFEQWGNIRKEAKNRNIEIIGDIPIFVSMDSSDVWVNKSLFFLDGYGRPKKVAGVPPDYFSEAGQLWGNPLYDFSVHKKDNYSWWLKRIEFAQKIYDIVRIDHFRGFSEYWAVPFGEETAINGKWEKGPGNSFFDTLFKKMPDVKIIAEDLGVLTDDVLKLRDDYKLPGMKILQFAFSDPSNEYLPHNFENSNCICYTGTHDNDTTLGFYSTADEKEKDYIRRYLNVDGSNIAYDFIRLCMSSSADVAIIPIQDLFAQGTESRMNVPSKPDGNWQYRFFEHQLTGQIENMLKYLVKMYSRGFEKLEID